MSSLLREFLPVPDLHRERHTPLPQDTLNRVLCDVMFCVDKWDIVKEGVVFVDWWDLYCHNPPTLLTTWQLETWTHHSAVYLLTHDWQAFGISRNKAIQGTHTQSPGAHISNTHIHAFNLARQLLCSSTVVLLYYSFTSENTEDSFNLHQQQGCCVSLHAHILPHTHSVSYKHTHTHLA